MSLDNLDPSLYPDDEPQIEEDEESASTGKLLGIFFGAAAVCAVFFGLGYNLGKNAGAQVPQIVVSPSAASNASNIPKPSAVRTQEQSSAAAAAPEPIPVTNTAQSQPNAPSVAARPAPEMARASAAGNFAVQVAAVSKEEDADALVSALRKKNYPVFVINGNAADKLFHVQVGPFASLADAEAVKSRLAGDGYNPILKK